MVSTGQCGQSAPWSIFLSAHDALGSETVEEFDSRVITGSYDEMLKVLVSVARFDRHYFPPVNALIGACDDNGLVALVDGDYLSPTGKERLQRVADENSLPVVKVSGTAPQ